MFVLTGVNRIQQGGESFDQGSPHSKGGGSDSEQGSIRLEVAPNFAFEAAKH